MTRVFLGIVLCLLVQAFSLHAIPPVLNYAGQVKVDGRAFNGTGYLKFALVSPSGDTTFWSQDGSSVEGGEPSGSVSVQVQGGLYSILLGNTAIDGMGAIDPSLFSTHSDLHLRVWFNDGVNGFERIVPDRPFASVPYAMSAGSATIENGSIKTDQLNEQILKYLRPEITQSPLLTKDREQIYTGQTITLSSDAEGKFLSYQWLKDGEPVPGATNREFTITDANGSLHNGNYTVQVSNDFGSVSSEAVQIDVNDTQLIHQIDLNATVSLEMIWVEPGTFTMGQAGVHSPEHLVTLSSGYYLGKYEVTQAQYEAVMDGNPEDLNPDPSYWSNNPNRPVEQVSHDDIQIFLTRLNAQEAGNIPEGWAYVLPTEGKWEYACRAGTTTKYSWGDSIDPTNANYNLNLSHSVDVGLYQHNPWGFYDMHGNIQEWVADWSESYSSASQTDPEGPVLATERVVRGGALGLHEGWLASSARGGALPSHRHRYFGFRLAFQQIPEDTKNPEFVVSGENNVTHLQNTAWVDPGVEAHDVRDGNITDSINVSGTVDVNTTGTYTLTYTVSDGAGNEASITRTINVGIPANYATDLNSTVSLEMIWVEPGTFTRGQSDISNASPEHEVTLTKGFYLGKYEVTQAQYEAVMTGNSDGLSATPSNFASNPNRPVEKVSWDDIQVFLTRLNAQEAGNIPAGWAYVLPTEAQWEYACRAGTTTAYSWGDTITSEDANYNNTIAQTTDVGQYSSNPWGFFDMHGNVWEWTSDWYATYSSGSVTDPEGPASGSNRVYRGGSWPNTGSNLRSANRNNTGPSGRSYVLGFRVGFQQIPEDTKNPEFVMSGENNVTHLLNTAWVDPGVEAHDVRDGNLTSDITVSGSVDVNTTGTYTLTYTVSDAAGNEASITRTVNVGIPASYATDLNSTVSLEMIWVEPGTFTMGQSNISNAPEHEVTLSNGFYLGKYEVTQAQYEAVMAGNTDSLSAKPSNWPNNPNRPVEKVSWDDIQAFLTRLNAQEAGNIPAGWAYVLPTEAQWEYACRAGTTTAYSWGDSITANDANWNHGNDANQTEDVGQYSANPWGFFDMHGNVWEWTADAWGTYASGAQTDPFNAGATGSNRVRRGGSWSDTGSPLRSAGRYNSTPNSRLTNIGFRLSLQKVPHVVDLNSTVSLEMIWVEPGTFTMGSPESETSRNNEAGRETQHEVTLTNGFYLGKYEVTQAQYEAVMTGNSDGLSATPSEWPNNPNRPVEKVSWEDIQKFLIRLNAQEAGNIPPGWAYVLPTEAQWEYACRAGTTTAYSWGDTINTDNANYQSSGYSQTRDVGLYDANPWGFFDMHGNVWELTADAWGTHGSGAQTDPFNAGVTGSRRVRRGGSWVLGDMHMRSANRDYYFPSTPLNDMGFRVGFMEQ